MAASEMLNRYLNPVILNLEKMELELKCPNCLNLLDKPILLPCTHVICSHCIANLTKKDSECPSCKLSFLHQDLRAADHIKSLVDIYRNMKSAIAAKFPDQVSQDSSFTIVTDNKMPADESPTSGNNSVTAISQRGTAKNVLGENLPNLLFEASNTMAQNEESIGVVDRQDQYNPPSFGGIKDLECHDSNQGSKHGRKRSPIVINDEDIRNKETNEINIRELKRQELNSEFNAELHGNTVGEDAHGNHPPIPELDVSRYLNANRVVKCVFCHSFRTTEGSGRMLHLLNGKEVDMDQTPEFHVHEKCILWAPQIYYSGDTVMNLEVELERALKIKCSRCGLKGAALGCYAMSCQKSYHVPCAYQILKCRWDCENYFVLCPAHVKHKLPCDKTKSGLNGKADHAVHSFGSSGNLAVLNTEPHEQSPVSPRVGKDWVFVGSALSEEEKVLMDKFSDISKAVVTNSWGPSVTHVIASVDNNGGCTRTLKFLLAILTGKWILSIEWIKASLKAGCPLQEESYEITHDILGALNGPKLGRLRAIQKAPKLLSGLHFYISGDFEQPVVKKKLEVLILTGGGTLAKKDDLLHFQDPTVKESSSKESTVKESSSKVFVIYNADPLLKGDTRDPNEVLKQRLDEAEAIVARFGGKAIRHTAFLDNIAASCFQKN